MVCPTCKGDGRFEDKSCPKCHGVGEVPGPKDTKEEREMIEEAIEYNKGFNL